MSKVAVIGAGLAGSLLAIYLAKRGILVDVYEARGDMRKVEVAAGRSINLALSDRGIAALRAVGMDEYMLAEAVPMYGRMIHDQVGETKLLRYSGREGEYINSVSRAGLNIALINEAERCDTVTFHFNMRCVDFDCETGKAMFENGEQTSCDTVIATDGAGSAVREAMRRDIPGFQISQVFLEHGYKELHIPPRDADTMVRAEREAFVIEPNALHIWPRHQFMMIALPNFDGSFTCTLFLANKSSPPYARSEVATASVDGVVLSDVAFDQLIDEAALLDFFNREFADAVALMPTLVEDFFQNPTGHLGTIKCWPWNIEGKALLLGDAAHAVVPFYGQGMNCSFEDVRVLDSLLPGPGAIATGSNIDWQSIFKQYGELRKVNTDAIADMAEENFYEMRDATADPVFQRKRELETRLEHTFPDYFSKYSMVTFREDLPYSVAKEKGNAQDAYLMNFCREIDEVASVDLASLREDIQTVITNSQISN